MARAFTLDFETASTVDLKKAGAWVYAESPLTRVLCLSITEEVKGATPRRWFPGEPTDWLAELASDPSVLFIAHNCAFEKAVWLHIMVADFGLPEIPLHRWHDTMAVAAYKAVPQSLERLAMVLGLPTQKDMEGRRLTMSFSRLDKKTGMLPEITSEKLLRIAQYCDIDVVTQSAAHNTLGWLTPEERKVWLFDQRINQRGIGIDLNYVRQCQKIVDEASLPLAAEFTKLTGLTVNQVKKVTDWLRAEGYNRPNLNKANVAIALGELPDEEEEDDEGGEDIDLEAVEKVPLTEIGRRALEIRSLIGSSSIKKLGAMMACTSADGRARGLLAYHGTAPGRWAGRLLQPQNFAKPVLKSEDDDFKDHLIDALLTGDHQYVDAVIGNPIKAVISGLRHAMVAGEGRTFIAGDYAGIQARVVLALAQQFDKVELMKNGADVYVDMACDMYPSLDRPRDKAELDVFKKVHDKERQQGKAAVLGCFAADTPVLTSRGFIPIVDVLTTDRLWDGKEWVTHDGLLRQGWKKVLTTMGTKATPEHPVLCGEQWHPWQHLVRDEAFRSQALATGSMNLPSWVTAMARVMASRISSSSVPAAMGLSRRIAGIWLKRKRADALGAQRKRRQVPEKTGVATPISCRMTATENGFSIAYRHASSAVKTLPRAHTPAMEAEEFASGRLGSRIGGNFLPTSSRLRAGIFPNLNSTGSMWTEATSPTISGSSRDKLTASTSEAFQRCKHALTSLSAVYDIAHAGPRNRFTILTNRGPVIVHNCGFGMGKNKFALTSKVDLEIAGLAVDTYRGVWAPQVPRLWRGLEAAAVKAVHSKRPQEAFGIEYRMEGDWLSCRLPSGRKIWYYGAQPCYRAMPWDENDIRPSFTSYTQKAGQWRKRDFFGGLLTENVVMGIERDIMVHGMVLAEKNGFPVVLNVHDEVIAEPLIADADARAYEQILSDTPRWAEEMKIPIAAPKPWIYPRYCK